MTEWGELPKSVLFACSLNSVRSPMAAAILNHLAGHRASAVSAGARRGKTDAFAAAAMDEIGIDISEHQPTAMSDMEETSFDLIITLSPEAHHQALELARSLPAEVEYWPVADPTAVSGSREQIMNAYRACRDQLMEQIKRRFGLGGAPHV